MQVIEQKMQIIDRNYKSSSKKMQEIEQKMLIIGQKSEINELKNCKSRTQEMETIQKSKSSTKRRQCDNFARFI